MTLSLARASAAVPLVGDAAGIKDHHLVGQLERELHVLLDEQDRLAFRLQARDGAADLGDDDRREALGGLVISSTRGLPISARPIASICCSPPEESEPACWRRGAP